LGGSLNVWRADPETGMTERLTVDLGTVPFIQAASLIKLSPDGRWISYVGDKSESDGRERSSRVELWLQPTEGGAEKQLTALSAHINAYSWAPDGRSIVLSGNRHGRYDVFKVDVPSGNATRLTDDELYEVYPTFTPSGVHPLSVLGGKMR
jgi:dipeptidyl aminopeptidase/acylaminoacyl peptidase